MLVDLLSEFYDMDFEEAWRTSGRRWVRAFAVRLHATGCSIREKW